MTDDLERWLGPVPTLLQVLPVAAEAATTHGRLVVPSVELWVDQVRVIYAAFPGPAFDADEGILGATGALNDDIGTDYSWGPSGGGAGDGRSWYGAVSFKPSPPLTASALFLHGLRLLQPLRIDLAPRA